MAYIGIDAKKDIRLNATSDLDLTSDSTTIKFGADDDVILTHVHNTGLLLNSTNQFQFGDSGTYIHQSADGVLDLVSDTEIEINATTIDINGNADVSGTLATGGNITINTGTSGVPAINLSHSNANADNFQITAGTPGVANSGFTIRDVDASANRLVIDTSGKVTIGNFLSVGHTNAPSYGVDIQTADTTAYGMRIKSTEEGGSALIRLESDQADDNHDYRNIIQDSDGNFRIQSYATGSFVDHMRIDSSGNVLVGTTDTTLYNNTSGGGFHTSQNGFTEISYESSSSGDPAFLVNNTGVDSHIIQFRKDGSILGNIHYDSNDYLTVESTSYLSLQQNEGSVLRSVILGNTFFKPFNADDNTLDLGIAAARWKDLYLSGGAYIGGTGSANYLDDYEEGTWTPSFSSGYTSATYTSQTGRYTKIGNTVRAYFRIELSGGTATSAAVVVQGLPFTSVNSSNVYTTATHYVNEALNPNGDNVKAINFPNSNLIYMLYQSTTTVSTLVGTNLGNGFDILGQIIYEAA